MESSVEIFFQPFTEQSYLSAKELIKKDPKKEHIYLMTLNKVKKNKQAKIINLTPFFFFF